MEIDHKIKPYVSKVETERDTIKARDSEVEKKQREETHILQVQIYNMYVHWLSMHTFNTIYS